MNSFVQNGLVVLLVSGVSGVMFGCEGNDSEVEELKNQVAALSTRVQELETEMASLTGGVSLSTLRSDVDTLQTDVGALQTSETSHGTRLDTLEGTATSHGTRLDSLETAVSATSDHTGRLAALETKTASITATDVDGKAAVVFEGVNVHIRSGSGHTEDSCPAPGTVCNAEDFLGLGNLIVGYNEPRGVRERNGSHNLVVGRGHEYTSYAGLVTGEDNTLSAPRAAIVGGGADTASGIESAVLGSVGCTASTRNATVYGGESGGTTDCQMVVP